MKKTIFKIAMLGLTIVSAPQLTNAQIGVGIKGGLNRSKLTNLNIIDGIFLGLHATIESSHRLNPLFGVMVNAKMNNWFSFQPEILYSFQGTALRINLSGVPISGALKLNYLQVPLLVKLSFGSQNEKLFINAGPYCSYLLSAYSYFKGPYTDSTENKIDLSDPDNKEIINRIDFGLATGLGLAFKVRRTGEIIFEVRFNHGLIDINKGETTEQPNYKPNKNMVITLSAGYMFYFGGK